MNTNDPKADAKKLKARPNLQPSEEVQEIPMACADETAAVEFLERRRWADSPACVHCGSVAVYKMTAADGGRSKRFLWRCRDCRQQYTVRVGTVFEDSRLPLRHWCYAFWRATTSKKGVSALEIMRQCQISYKSALFLMNRIRFAMAPGADAPKIGGAGEIVEADETYVGGKPRFKGQRKLYPESKKQPVFAVVERGGEVRTKVVANVTGATLRAALDEFVDPKSRVMTDESSVYGGLEPAFAGHETVNHSNREYARGDVTTNNIEGFFSLLKRAIYGIYHNVSKEHLHRYVSETEFRFNNRDLNDGQRMTKAINAGEGKRLMYRESRVSSVTQH